MMSSSATDQNAADMVVLHSVGFLASAWRDDANYALVIDTLRAALPKASRSVPMIADFAAAGEMLATAETLSDHTAARHRARYVIERMHLSKMASAAAKMRGKSGGA